MRICSISCEYYMDNDWNIVIFAELQKDRIYKISGWTDLSVFLLCYWPVKYGVAYTAAVCSLSQNYYKRSNTDHIIKLFILALQEAEIPYSLERNTSNSGNADGVLPATLPASSSL